MRDVVQWWTMERKTMGGRGVHDVEGGFGEVGKWGVGLRVMLKTKGDDK